MPFGFDQPFAWANVARPTARTRPEVTRTSRQASNTCERCREQPAGEPHAGTISIVESWGIAWASARVFERAQLAEHEPEPP